MTKTSMFSLAGNQQPGWQTLLSAFQGQWHDYNSPEALIYLGYPIYHSEYQLNGFLSRIFSKLERHINILMSRSLSILGRSHIANSLLLSKLWHILRVIDPPTRWLKQCERATRNYVCPYGYKPSWRTICRPKNQSGAAVIDIQQQSQALKMIHLQTCADAASTNFLPQVLRSIFRAHTGHASLLTLSITERNDSFVATRFLPCSTWPESSPEFL
jgi:hypothetical protein